MVKFSLNQFSGYQFPNAKNNIPYINGTNNSSFLKSIQSINNNNMNSNYNKLNNMNSGIRDMNMNIYRSNMFNNLKNKGGCGCGS